MKPVALALLELLDRDGHVRQSLQVHAWPVHVGRAIDNDFVLDDPHVADRHFTVDVLAAADADTEAVAPTVEVVAARTVNGLHADRRRLHAGERAAVGPEPMRIDVGDSHLRLRLASHALAPELPLVLPSALWLRAGLPALAGALALAALLFATWLATDPSQIVRALSTELLAAPVLALAWCGAWSIVTKVFTRRSRFGWHLRVLLCGALAYLAASALCDVLAFSLSWPAISGFSFVLTDAVIGTVLYFHLLRLEPRRAGRMRAVAAGMVVAAIGFTLWSNQQARGQWADELYMNHLFPPALRLARPVPSDAFVQGLAPLQEKLDRAAAKNESGGDDAGDGAE